MTTCLSCINWSAPTTVAWALRLGMRSCSVKNTKAVTLNHWAACPSWRSATTEQTEARVAWLSRVGHAGKRTEISTTPIAA